MSAHVRGELAEFLVGALDAAATERVAEHVSSCAECGRELALLQSLEGSLGELRSVRRGRPGWPLAAAALVAAACLAGLLLRPHPARVAPEAPQERTGPLVLACGSRIEARPLARLEVAAPREVVLLAGRARFDVVPQKTPFQVRTPRGTAVVLGTSFVVEVEGDVNAKIPTAAAVVTITVVSGAILWRSADGLPETRVKAGEQAVVRAGSIELKAAPESAPEASLAKENAALRAKLAEITRRNVELETRVATIGSATAVTPSAAAPAPTAPPTEKAAARSDVRIRPASAKQVDALAQVKNWRELAEACRTLGPIIKEVVGLQAKGEKVPSELLTKLVSENNKLVGLAAAVHGHFATHASGNGEYTHPLVLGNLMAHHLELAGLALDDRQVDEIARIGAEFDARYEQMQATYGAQTLLLEKILDELDLKKVYVGRIEALLSVSQQQALFDPETKGVYAVDLYSPLLMLVQRIAPIAKGSLEELKKSIAKSWVRDWELGDRNVDALADAFLRELAPQPIPANAVGSFRLDDALVAGRATVKAMKEALRTLALDEDTAKELAAQSSFVLPRLTAPAK